MGIKERLKLAEENRVSAERGGRPCLASSDQLSKHRENSMAELLN